MTRSHSLRIAVASLLFAGLASLPAHAVNKDIIQLQTQVQQLQDAIANLQKTNDESIGMLRELVQQTADAVNKMSVNMDGLKLSMQNQQDAASTKDQQLSGQVQSLNDSVDELKARLARMATTLGNIQSQQQTTNAALSNLPQAGGAGTPNSNPNGALGSSAQGIPAGTPNSNPNGALGSSAQGIPAGTPNSNPNGALGSSAQGIPAGTPSNNSGIPGYAEPVPAPRAPAEPSVGDLYRGAYADYISAKYPLAASEFSDLIKAYPDDNLSGNAYFYLGEMDMRSHKPSTAIKDYDQVLERYPDNAKVPAAHLHKAYALLDTRQITAGERELRALIQRFPNSPESSQARAKLSTLRNRE